MLFLHTNKKVQSSKKRGERQLTNMSWFLSLSFQSPRNIVFFSNFHRAMKGDWCFNRKDQSEKNEVSFVVYWLAKGLLGSLLFYFFCVLYIKEKLSVFMKSGERESKRFEKGWRQHSFAFLLKKPQKYLWSCIYQKNNFPALNLSLKSFKFIFLEQKLTSCHFIPSIRK